MRPVVPALSLWVALLGCGRVRFEPRDGGLDARLVDAAMDASGTDARIISARCAAALSDPSTASDTDLWDCGTSSQLGACIISDSSACVTCSCDAYTRSSEICDASGCSMGVGTGCSDGPFFNVSPWFCSGDRVTQSACIVRWLIREGLCDGV